MWCPWTPTRSRVRGAKRGQCAAGGCRGGREGTAQGMWYGQLLALGSGVVHEGRCVRLCQHPTPGAIGGSPRRDPCPRDNCPGRSHPPQPLDQPRGAAVRCGGSSAEWRTAGHGVRCRPRGQSGVGSGIALRDDSPAHPVPGGPLEGHGDPPGSDFGVSMHVAHPLCRHAPAALTSPGGSLLPVVVVSWGQW